MSAEEYEILQMRLSLLDGNKCLLEKKLKDDIWYKNWNKRKEYEVCKEIESALSKLNNVFHRVAFIKYDNLPYLIEGYDDIHQFADIVDKLEKDACYCICANNDLTWNYLIFPKEERTTGFRPGRYGGEINDFKSYVIVRVLVISNEKMAELDRQAQRFAELQHERSQTRSAYELPIKNELLNIEKEILELKDRMHAIVIIKTPIEMETELQKVQQTISEEEQKDKASKLLSRLGIK